MRCNNCGWENPDGSATCEKCHASLSSSSNHQYSDEPVNLRGTLSEDAVFGASHPHQLPHYEQGGCPNCGYPVRPGAAVCPNCGETLSSGNGGASQPSGKASGIHGGIQSKGMTPPPFTEREPASGSSNRQADEVHHVHKVGRKCQKCGAEIGTDAKFCPTCGAPTRMGTINPWMQPQAGTFCTLRPVSWEGENIEYQPLTFSGTVISLNRANTDPENQTITSKQQAVLTYEDGAWLIEDASEQKTTYLHVGRKTKLSDGDIIILGNRMFEFKG